MERLRSRRRTLWGVVPLVAVAALASVAVAARGATNKAPTLVIDNSFTIKTSDPQRAFDPTASIVDRGIYDTLFTYKGGEYFNFRGDDDVFVFIDHQLVINLGGIHDPELAQVNVDTLGLTLGQTYPLDFFSAERHVVGSNILFETTLNLQPPPQ